MKVCWLESLKHYPVVDFCIYWHESTIDKMLSWITQPLFYLEICWLSSLTGIIERRSVCDLATLCVLYILWSTLGLTKYADMQSISFLISKGDLCWHRWCCMHSTSRLAYPNSLICTQCCYLMLLGANPRVLSTSRSSIRKHSSH